MISWPWLLAACGLWLTVGIAFGLLIGPYLRRADEKARGRR